MGSLILITIVMHIVGDEIEKEKYNRKMEREKKSAEDLTLYHYNQDYRIDFPSNLKCNGWKEILL